MSYQSFHRCSVVWTTETWMAQYTFLTDRSVLVSHGHNSASERLRRRTRHSIAFCLRVFLAAKRRNQLRLYAKDAVQRHRRATLASRWSLCQKGIIGKCRSEVFPEVVSLVPVRTQGNHRTERMYNDRCTKTRARRVELDCLIRDDQSRVMTAVLKSRSFKVSMEFIMHLVTWWDRRIQH